MPDEGDETQVIVGTSNGGRSHFHLDDTCRYVQQMRHPKPIPRSDAEDQGLLVCSICDRMAPPSTSNRRASLEDILAGRA